MKRKPNPIVGTVKNFVRAKGKRIPPSSRSPIARFFWDLEERGPFSPNSLYKEWTVRIRKQMQRAGTWIEDDSKVSLEFVAEYVGRLQRLYRRYHQVQNKKESTLHYWWIDSNRIELCYGLRVYRAIYLKIRMWGRRTKNFTLTRWKKRDRWPDHYIDTYIWPWGSIMKYRAGEEGSLFKCNWRMKTFFEKQIFRNQGLVTS